jgi:hypothetical protein
MVVKIVKARKTTNVAPCATRNAGSVCVRAHALSSGIFRNDWTITAVSLTNRTKWLSLTRLDPAP